MKQSSLMRRWADATRHLRRDEADQLWQELMDEWLKPTVIDQISAAQRFASPRYAPLRSAPHRIATTRVIDQNYWNSLLDRRMAVLERKQQRSTISDDEWDKLHEDVNR